MLTKVLRRNISMAIPHVEHLSRLPAQSPIVLILGATGTGKSNLAIQLAQWLASSPNEGFKGAEIVNADAMQIYRGLPIITNKVTPIEQRGIPHHLLDHLDLVDEPWTVQNYVKEADQVISAIRSRGKIPIVVGGTSYYVYGLLFKDAMIEKDTQNSNQHTTEETPSKFGKDAGEIWPILDASNEEIYARLKEVDPEQAMRWHPNDRRRIQRSLEIYLRSGRKASEVYYEQKQTLQKHCVNENKDDFPANSTLRYDAIIFWIEAEDKILKDRLNRRVDGMVENGLLLEAQEMSNLSQSMQNESVAFDKTKGIWVSIGYKEMEPWTNACQRGESSQKELDSTKHDCIEAVKAGTRQYAKRQTRFIRLRLADALSNAKLRHRLFLLDGTDLEQWQDEVQQPAQKVVNLFIRGEKLPEPSTLSELAKTTFAGMTDGQAPSERIARTCETCNKILMTEKEWIRHVDSRSHKVILQAIRKREANGERNKLAESSQPVEAG